MNEDQREWRRWLEAVLLGLGCLAIYWAGNDRVSLWDRDEPRYAESARIMLETGDFIVPYFNGEFRFQKPILNYWLIALSYTLLGQGEFAVRFFAGLSVAGTALLVWSTGNRLFGRPAGLIAGTMFALCPMSFFLGKLSLPDAPQLFCSCLCYWVLIRCSGTDNRPSRFGSLLFGIALGCAVLAKGPIVPAMIAATLLAYRCVPGGRISDFRINWLTSMAAAVAVTAPWLLAVWFTTGGEFFAEAIGNQLGGRAAGSFAERHAWPGYYLISILLGFAPWTPLALLAMIRDRQRFWKPGPEALILAWLVGPLVLLEAVQTKQLHYYAPCYPAWSLLAANYLARLWRGEIAWQRDGHARRMTWGLAAYAVLFAGAFLLLGFGGPSDVRAAATAVGIGLTASSAAACWLTCRQRIERSWIVQAAAQGAVALAISIWLLPGFESSKATRRAGERLAALAAEADAPAILHMLMEPSLVYYAERELPIYYMEDYFLARVRDADADLFAALTEEEYRRLDRELPGRMEVIESHPGLVRMHSDIVHVVRIHPAALVVNRADELKMR